MNNKLLSAVIVTAVVAGGIGFFGGSSYATSSGAPSQTTMPGQFGQGGAFAGAGGRTRGAGTGGAAVTGGFVTGDILSKDATSITVKTQDGGSKIVLVSGSTSITKTATGSVSDLTVGQRVTVTGTTNADGSVSAQMVQLRPASSTFPR